MKQNNGTEKSKDDNCGYGACKRTVAANHSTLGQAARARTKKSSKGKASRDAISAATGINAGPRMRHHMEY